MKGEELTFKFEEWLSSTGPVHKKTLKTSERWLNIGHAFETDWKMDKDEEAEKTAELLKDLFPDFSYVKRKRKPKKK